jgi:hypothetical protein
MPEQMQVLDSQLQLKNIKRLLNGEIAGVKLPVSDTTREILLIEVCCLEVGLESGGVQDAINKVGVLVLAVRRLAGAA